jgi:uncharacterized protein YbbK (DUF523 family)
MILVSSCLLGLNTRYDGISNDNPLLIRYCRCGKFIPICPEQLGGLPTPRKPAEITGGDGNQVLSGSAKIFSTSKEDVTLNFIKGSEEVLKILKIIPVTAAILKERSPSCGANYIYDGSFNSIKIKGAGVTAALLKTLNIPVYSEEEIDEKLLKKLVLMDQIINGQWTMDDGQ